MEEATQPPEHDRTPTLSRLPYIPGLDGIRAVAVIAVLLFHAGLSVWGGFLGVESFFVLSGFLITALLVVEWRATRRINLRNFWIRRGRRLLPALFLLLIGTTIIGLFLPNGETTGLGADTLAALGYVFNWHMIAGGNSYFDPFVRPSLLQHLWSLAVEEQFYLLWPVLLLLGARYLRPLALLLITLALAAGSFALMAWLHVPGIDPSRVYYGTDTRAGGLLLGAALAICWNLSDPPGATRRLVGAGFDLLGLAGFAGLIYGFTNFHEQDPFLYQGGFVAIAFATIAVIMAVCHPQARLIPALLGAAPLRWIGKRSYAIYLWHWPIFQITRPYIDVPLDGWQLLVVRLAIVLVLADLSYRLVERPIRNGALGRLRERLATRRAPQPTGTARLSASNESALIGKTEHVG